MSSILSYLKANGKWAFIFMVALATTMLGPLNGFASLYPLAVIIGAVICLSRTTSSNMLMLLLVLACLISLLFNSPHPVFKAWHRLGYAVLLFACLTPLTSSQQLHVFRKQLFLWVMRLCVFIGVGSFIGYFLGINYMPTNLGALALNTAGLFGGLTGQSMLLGPLAGLGATYVIWLHFERRAKTFWPNILRWGCVLACTGSMLLSASRGALLATLVATLFIVFMYLKHAPQKLFKVSFCIVLGSLLFLPFIQHFGASTLNKHQANLEAGSAFASRSQLWEDRKKEFLSAPIYGIGFASQKIISYEQSLTTGTLEPGTSYGAIFAMTGVLGGIPFLFLLFSNMLSRPRNRNGISYMSPPQAALAFFAVHMSTEGYVFAAGSGLAGVFWISIGGAYAYSHLK